MAGRGFEAKATDSTACAPSGSTSNRAAAASRARLSSSRGFSATAFLGVIAGVEEPLVGDVQVGQKDLGGGHPRVDLEGTLGLLPAGGELVALQIGLAEGDDHLGGGRVDLEGPGQFLAGVPLLIAGEEQAAFEPGGLPAVGVGPKAAS